MKPRWRKVIHDLFDNKARTLLVVLSIAVGVLSIGIIVGAYRIISTDLPLSYAASSPANVLFRMANFDEDTLTFIGNQQPIDQVEGRRVFNIRVRVPSTEKWTTLDMNALDDFEKNTINLLSPIEGAQVPGKKEILLEQAALDDLNIQVGDLLEFQLPDGSIKTFPVVGIVQDIATGAGDFMSAPYGYITMDTLAYLGQPNLYNRALVTLNEGQDDMNTIRQVGADVKSSLEKNGEIVYQMRYSETHTHPLSQEVSAISGILIAMGVLIVFLSSSLIANTLSALLTQHLRHIGVIKLVGGQRRQVIFMYLALILSFGVLALLIAIPLGGRGAYELSLFVANELNFQILSYRIIPLSLIVQILVGLLVPLIAGLAPVLNGSRITVLRALSGGSETGEAPADSAPTEAKETRSLADRLNGLFPKRKLHIPRPFTLSLRNTFRRKSRLALTLFTLTMGGAILIAVFNVRISLNSYMDEISKYFVADISLEFDQPYRLREVEQIAMQVEGITYIEGWQYLNSEMLDANDAVLDNMIIFGPSANSSLIEPNLLSGRWIQEDDVHKLAVSDSVLLYYPDLQPGDMLNITVGRRSELWEVVGIFKFVDRQGVIAYAPYEYLVQVNDQANQSSSYRLVTTQHDRAFQEAKAEELDRTFRDRGFSVRLAEPGMASIDQATEYLNTVVVFLLIMAILTAVVGSIGLTGTMSMNVMERTREIGIMRAIGADDRAVMRTVIAEGVVVGMISFVLSVILSIPITYLFSTIVSVAVFNSPMQVLFTYEGFAIWLALILALSTVASIVPAQNAARLTIREVLAYE
ncbi:ABC transporter permease [bacterium]|nr:ABC transporter permease [bacterium]